MHKRIVHISDIHFRSLQRHQEFSIVFDAFEQEVRKLNVDLIIVAGDIFHTKTSGISPEVIQVMSRWMKQLANIAPTHMILGNHDFSISNLERQDAITPIYELIKDQYPDRLFLHKFSGVYDLLPGYKLCVFSLCDDNWEDVKPVPGVVNIAMYHGPVQGAKTDENWEVENGVNLDLFKTFDFVMLGDIHASQYLAYRTTINNVERPWIAYPGSAIQQNYAESLDHGYLLWDIKDRNDFDVTFKCLPNPNPFITLTWKGNVEDTLAQVNLKKNSRVRIKSDDFISQNDIHELSNKLTFDSGSCELTFKIDKSISTDQQHKINDVILTGQSNLRDVNTLIRLIKQQNNSDCNWENVENLLKQYLSTVCQDQELARYTTWSFDKLRFNNLFAYGEDNVINFADLKGITGIFAPNRMGKSSITGAILYALFNASDRGSIKNQAICNTRKQYCSVDAEITANNSKYLLQRQTTKRETKKGDVVANTVLNVFELCGDEKRDLCGDGRIDTDKVIRQLIGTADDLMLTGISTQGDLEQFVKNKSTSRWQSLARFLDIDFLSEIHKLVNDDIKTIKAQLKNFPDKNWNELAKKLIASHTEVEQNILTKTKEHCDLTAKLQSVLYEFEQKKDQKIISEEQVLIQKKLIDDLQSKKNDTFSQIHSNKQTLANLTTKLVTLRAQLNTFDDKKLRNNINELKIQKEKLSTLSATNTISHNNLKNAKKSLDLLQEVPCNDAFPTCNFIKDAHQNKLQYNSLWEQHTKLMNEYENLNSVVQTLISENAQNKLDEQQKLIESISKIETEQLKLTNSNLTLNVELTKYSTSLDVALVEYEKLQDLFKDSENKRVLVLTHDIDVLKQTLLECDKQKIEFATLKGKVENELLVLQSEKKKRNELLLKLRDYEILDNAFSKRGLPKQIITLKLPIINAEITKILSGIVSYSVEFEEDSDTDKLDIYLNDGDSRRIIELGSGMEKMIASIAIRTALFNVSTLPKPNFFIIDEGFGALDDENIEACIRLLKSLTHYFKSILIISHIDAIKDAVDNVLEIVKVGKDSKIVYN